MEILYNEMINNNIDMVKCNYSILMGEDISKYDTGKNEYLSIEPKGRDLIYLPVMFGIIYIIKNLY